MLAASERVEVGVAAIPTKRVGVCGPLALSVILDVPSRVRVSVITKEGVAMQVGDDVVGIEVEGDEVIDPDWGVVRVCDAVSVSWRVGVRPVRDSVSDGGDDAEGVARLEEIVGDVGTVCVGERVNGAVRVRAEREVVEVGWEDVIVGV